MSDYTAERLLYEVYKDQPLEVLRRDAQRTDLVGMVAEAILDKRLRAAATEERPRSDRDAKTY